MTAASFAGTSLPRLAMAQALPFDAAPPTDSLSILFISYLIFLLLDMDMDIIFYCYSFPFDRALRFRSRITVMMRSSL